MQRARSAGGRQGAAVYREALRGISKKRPDIARVKGLLEKALKSGSPDAAYALATWYLHGHNVERDLKEGVLLLRRAAKANVPNALFDLAICYEKGVGVRKNDRLALECYLRAALRGEKQSIHEVGRCFYFGIGTSRNTRMAWVWLDRAKELGCS